MLLKSQLIESFKDTILQYELNVTLLDSQGSPGEGTGVGVTKKIFPFFHRVSIVLHSREVR